MPAVFSCLCLLKEVKGQSDYQETDTPKLRRTGSEQSFKEREAQSF